MEQRKLTIDDLKKIKDQYRRQMTVRSGEARARVIVHMGTCGIAAGSRDVLDAALKEIEARGITDVLVTTSSCAGLCSREPMATVEIEHQPPVKYVDLTPDTIVKVIREHVVGGTIVTELALAVGSETTG